MQETVGGGCRGAAGYKHMEWRWHCCSCNNEVQWGCRIPGLWSDCKWKQLDYHQSDACGWQSHPTCHPLMVTAFCFCGHGGHMGSIALVCSNCWVCCPLPWVEIMFSFWLWKMEVFVTGLCWFYICVLIALLDCWLTVTLLVSMVKPMVRVLGPLHKWP